MNRRGFFQSLAKTVAIVALAPQLAFNARPRYEVLGRTKYAVMLDEGNFRKWVAPIIMSMSPSPGLAPLLDIQPMDGPPSAVFHMDFVRRKSWWQRLFNL